METEVFLELLTTLEKEKLIFSMIVFSVKYKKHIRSFHFFVSFVKFFYLTELKIHLQYKTFNSIRWLFVIFNIYRKSLQMQCFSGT